MEREITPEYARIMDFLEYPTVQLWRDRNAWFENAEEVARGEGLGDYLVSEHACALSAEVQAVFCAGAWAAVIILALSVIDAQLREVEVPGFRDNSARLIDATTADAALHRLRIRRNKLVHVEPNTPGLTVDLLWGDRGPLEDEAKEAVTKEAVTLMFRIFYLSPRL